MARVKRCSTCGGTKSVMGLGMIMHKCKECKGLGYHMQADEQDEDAFLNEKQDIVVPQPKKRGRKPKEAVLQMGA